MKDMLRGKLSEGLAEQRGKARKDCGIRIATSGGFSVEDEAQVAEASAGSV